MGWGFDCRKEQEIKGGDDDDDNDDIAIQSIIRNYNVQLWNVNIARSLANFSGYFGSLQLR